MYYFFLDFLQNTYSYLAEHQSSAKRSWGNAGLSRNANELLSCGARFNRGQHTDYPD